MKRRHTIMDVAALAGVSKSTVRWSCKARSRCGPRRARRSRPRWPEIGYVYNRAAANLRSASVGLVGVLINDLRNPFFTEFATSLQMALAAEGYATVIANADEDAELQAKLVGLDDRARRLGIVISPLLR